MATNTTPVAPNADGNKTTTKKGVDPRQPLVTDMQSARDYGRCSPSKGKVNCPDEDDEA